MSHKPHDGSPVPSTSPAAALAKQIADQEGKPVDPRLVQPGDPHDVLPQESFQRAVTAGRTDPNQPYKGRGA